MYTAAIVEGGRRGTPVRSCAGSKASPARSDSDCTIVWLLLVAGAPGARALKTATDRWPTARMISAVPSFWASDARCTGDNARRATKVLVRARITNEAPIKCPSPHHPHTPLGSPILGFGLGFAALRRPPAQARDVRRVLHLPSRFLGALPSWRGCLVVARAREGMGGGDRTRAQARRPPARFLCVGFAARNRHKNLEREARSKPAFIFE